jgi:hypothetical protein
MPCECWTLMRFYFTMALERGFWRDEWSRSVAAMLGCLTLVDRSTLTMFIDSCSFCYPAMSTLQYFDQDRGADMLKKVLSGEVDGDLIAKYIVLSGAYCLLRYAENCGGFSYAPHSMR